MEPFPSPVLSMTLFEDRLLACGAQNSTTALIDIVSGEVMHRWAGKDGPVTALCTATVEG